jgi:LEA14-like dessication related protein
MLTRLSRNAVLLALCVAALSGAGCTLIRSIFARGFEPPGVSFQSASLSEISLEGATLNLLLKVDNPNGDALSLAETDYRLLVEGKPIATGKPPNGILIPGRGSADVVLPAAIRFSELASSVEAVLKRKAVAWSAEGHIGVETPVGIVALPFATQGNLTLPKIPKVTVGSPTVSDISLSGATLQLPLVVENENEYPLPLADVTGALRVAGAEVGHFAARDLGRLDAQGKKTITLPVAMRFAGATAAWRALQSGRAEVAVSGVLGSGGASLPFNFVQEVVVQR